MKISIATNFLKRLKFTFNNFSIINNYVRNKVVLYLVLWKHDYKL